jgi:hypothetical protein
LWVFSLKKQIKNDGYCCLALIKHVVPTMVCVWLNVVCLQNRNPRLVVMQRFWFATQ